MQKSQIFLTIHFLLGFYVVSQFPTIINKAERQDGNRHGTDQQRGLCLNSFSATYKQCDHRQVT